MNHSQVRDKSQHTSLASPGDLETLPEDKFLSATQHASFSALVEIGIGHIVITMNEIFINNIKIFICRQHPVGAKQRLL